MATSEWSLTILKKKDDYCKMDGDRHEVGDNHLIVDGDHFKVEGGPVEVEGGHCKVGGDHYTVDDENFKADCDDFEAQGGHYKVNDDHFHVELVTIHFKVEWTVISVRWSYPGLNYFKSLYTERNPEILDHGVSS